MLIKRAWRFGVTGLATTGVYLIVAVTIIKLVTLSQPFATGVAFVAATAFSYLLNTLWTFTQPLHNKNLLRYTLAALVGLCVALIIAGFAQLTGCNYVTGILMVSCAVPPVNFAMHYLWTYR